MFLDFVSLEFFRDERLPAPFRKHLGINKWEVREGLSSSCASVSQPVACVSDHVEFEQPARPHMREWVCRCMRATMHAFVRVSVRAFSASA